MMGQLGAAFLVDFEVHIEPGITLKAAPFCPIGENFS